MKNTLMIDLDSERKDPIRITKPEEVLEEIKDEDKAKKMVLDDLTTVCNALGALIQVAEDSGYFSGEQSAKMCIEYLEDNFINKK
jgi:hypothetical protein